MNPMSQIVAVPPPPNPTQQQQQQQVCESSVESTGRRRSSRQSNSPPLQTPPARCRSFSFLAIKPRHGQSTATSTSNTSNTSANASPIASTPHLAKSNTTNMSSSFKADRCSSTSHFPAYACGSGKSQPRFSSPVANLLDYRNHFVKTRSSLSSNSLPIDFFSVFFVHLIFVSRLFKNVLVASFNQTTSLVDALIIICVVVVFKQKRSQVTIERRQQVLGEPHGHADSHSVRAAGLLQATRRRRAPILARSRQTNQTGVRSTQVRKGQVGFILRRFVFLLFIVRENFIMKVRENNRRETWHLHSASKLWEALLADTKQHAKYHQVASEVCSKYVAEKFDEIIDDIKRIFNKVNSHPFLCVKLLYIFVILLTHTKTSARTSVSRRTTRSSRWLAS